MDDDQGHHFMSGAVRRPAPGTFVCAGSSSRGLSKLAPVAVIFAFQLGEKTLVALLAS